MANRQAINPSDYSAADNVGRAAQRRRTRAAIIYATTRLVAEGRTPSVDDIAAAADVSRRTIYMYFPTLDQLLLDATIGALSAATVDAALAPPADPGGDDSVLSRVDALVQTLVRSAPTTLPLGRKIIALTVDAPAVEGPGDAPQRGYRRIEWIERAVEPLRDAVSAEQYERLVSALSVVAGWEAMIVLRDVGGLAPAREEQVLRWAAASLVSAILHEAGESGPESTDLARSGD